MNILIIGGGGREHALAWKTAQSARVRKVYVAPGNAGTAREAKCANVTLAVEDVEGLLKFAQSNKIDLTIVGPEAPLVLGVVDRFRAAGLRCFGPVQAAAQLEGSKAYAKDFLARYKIPTAAYGCFTDVAAAEAFIRKMGAPIVVKADGLAAGKGVIIAETTDEAIRAVHDMLAGNAFGEAGHRVVVEEFLEGEEASFIVMADGSHVLALATSQDHKRVGDGDTGPNTGGMGAYSPAPVMTPALVERTMAEIIWPTVEGMAAAGAPFTGVLYAGLMITGEGPKLIEYNVRFGDPECQVLVMRMKDDLLPVLLATANGSLAGMTVDWHDDVALTVVMAAAGYPGTPKKGGIIRGLEVAGAGEDVVIFHAGTARGNGDIVANGGRVLDVTALGQTVSEARDRAYAAVEKIDWADGFCRTDIGWRAIERERN